MKIYTKAGALAFKAFTFPDGQPHFVLETYERDFSTVTIEMALKSPVDLFTLQLAAHTLRQHGFGEILLDIRYLMGARMDRAISWAEPFTLAVVAQTLNSCGFAKVRILDAHSETATRLIRNSANVLPFQVVEQVLTTVGPDIRVVCPDKGAKERTYALTRSWGQLICYCSKMRDMATGRLSGFKVEDENLCRGQNVLIIDDICDGGGTFVGLAKELRNAGAKKVYLYVTHGIFSKHVSALTSNGIDHVYTTNSYLKASEEDATKIGSMVGLTVIPISMEKL